MSRRLTRGAHAPPERGAIRASHAESVHWRAQCPKRGIRRQADLFLTLRIYRGSSTKEEFSSVALVETWAMCPCFGVPSNRNRRQPFELAFQKLLTHCTLCSHLVHFTAREHRGFMDMKLLEVPLLHKDSELVLL